MNKKFILITRVTSPFFAAFLPRENVFVDPAIGSISNDGSEAKPWSTLKEVFDSSKIEIRKFKTKPASAQGAMVVKNPGAPVKAGDTIVENICRFIAHGKT